MAFIRAYLRASTDDQDATRAREDLERFVTERGLKVAAWYTENESGAKLDRPELFRLIADAHVGDVLLVEQVDRGVEHPVAQPAGNRLAQLGFVEHTFVQQLPTQLAVHAQLALLHLGL